MKKSLLAFLFAAVVLVGLTGCGTSEASLAGTYTNGSKWEYVYGETPMGNSYGAYAVEIYDDGSYEMTYSEIVDMGGVVAGTTTIKSYGEYVKGEASDGFVELTMNAPTHVLYNSYSTLGGFAFDYDTDVDTTFIIPGGDDQGIDKETFMSQIGYGEAKVFYIALDSTNNETCRIETSMN